MDIATAAPILATSTPVTTVYDLIQRFEVSDGKPRLLSTHITVISSIDSEDLMSSAKKWIQKNTFLREVRRHEYIGFREEKTKGKKKRYQLIICGRRNYLQIHIPKNVNIEDIDVKSVESQLFPYTNSVYVDDHEKLLILLERACANCCSISP